MKYLRYEWLLIGQEMQIELEVDDWWDAFFNLVLNTNKKFIYYDNLHEHHVHTDESEYLSNLDYKLGKTGKKLYISLSGHRGNQHNTFLYSKLNNIKVFLFPTFHLHFLINGMKKDILNIKRPRSYEKMFINLNNHYKHHKYELVKSLYKNNLEKYGVITYLDENTNDWNIPRIDDGPQNSGLFNLSFHHNPLIDLVSESESEYLRITEKTWKPITLGQIFLVNGGINFHKNLKDMGFQLYDEIFDYSFDENSNIIERIDGIINNLHNLRDKNYDEIFTKVQEKIVYNRQRAQKIYENYEYVSPSYLDLMIQIKKDLITDGCHDVFYKKNIFDPIHEI